MKKTILVIGDVMLDVYIRGEVRRISSEAPVPVLLLESREMTLGGAGNVAHNIISLGGNVRLVCVVGADAEGKVIQELCCIHGINPHIFIEEGRRTTVKTRVLARQHQLVRIDEEVVRHISPKTEEKLCAFILKMREPHWIIISDYAKGVITPRVLMALVRRCGRDRIIADFKSENTHLFKGFYAIVPNLKEAYNMTGIYADTPARADRALRVLSHTFKSSIVLKRGEFGMALYERTEDRISHISTYARDVFDVTGAGDRVIAILACMRAEGKDLREAARIANIGAGIVVGKRGTAVVTREELMHHEDFRNTRELH